MKQAKRQVPGFPCIKLLLSVFLAVTSAKAADPLPSVNEFLAADWDARSQAFYSIWKKDIATQRAAVHLLVPVLDDRNTERRRKAIEVLVRIGQNNAEAISDIRPKLLAHIQEEVQDDRFHPISLLGPGDIAYSPAVVELLKTSKRMRVDCIAALTRMNALVTAIPALIDLLSDDNQEVVFADAEGLGSLGPKARPAIPVLVAAFRKGRIGVEPIARVGGFDPEWQTLDADALREALLLPDAAAREKAISELAAGEFEKNVSARNTIVSPPVEPAVFMRALERGDWKMAAVKPLLPSAEMLNEIREEDGSWREYAYDGGALRLYTNWDSDVIAVLADTENSRYAGFAKLPTAEGYKAYRKGRYAVVVRVATIDEATFLDLRSKSWSQKELEVHLGAPTYRWHAHGVGFYGLVYAPQGLTFDDALSEPFSLSSDRRSNRFLEILDLPESQTAAEIAKERESVTYADYRRDAKKLGEKLASALAEEQPSDIFAKGLRSPDGRFAATTIYTGYGNGGSGWPRFLIKEKGKAERRISSAIGSSVGWLDNRTILTEKFSFVTGDVYFYSLNVTDGTQYRLLHLLEKSYRGVEAGASGDRRFWYKTPDGQRHEVDLRKLSVHSD